MNMVLKMMFDYISDKSDKITTNSIFFKTIFIRFVAEKESQS